MAGTKSKDEIRLMAYMVGWRKGAKGAVLTSVEASHPEIAQGHADGRQAAGKAYVAACEIYQATLSPLR